MHKLTRNREHGKTQNHNDIQQYCFEHQQVVAEIVSHRQDEAIADDPDDDDDDDTVIKTKR